MPEVFYDIISNYVLLFELFISCVSIVCFIGNIGGILMT